jgi:hypothetical protein
MRILHVSHQQLKYLGSRNYLFPVRINNGLIRNNHDVIWFSDRDLARCSNVFGSRQFGRAKCNKRLLQVCENFRPDVIALCAADIIEPDTISAARRFLPNAAVFQYYIDALFIEENKEQVRAKANVVDHTFVTTAGPILKQLAGRNSAVSFIPNPVDPSIDRYQCHLRSDQSNDILFAGNAHRSMDKDDLRMKAFQLLREHVPQARCAFYGEGYQPSLFGSRFLEAIGNSKIGLSFSQRSPQASTGVGGDLYLYSSDRIGMYLGNGLLVFTTNAFSLTDLYGPEAIVEVKDADDFVEKIAYFLDDARRQAFAYRGYELAHSEFNERLVSQYMVETTMQLPHSHDYRWPLEIYRR